MNVRYQSNAKLQPRDPFALKLLALLRERVAVPDKIKALTLHLEIGEPIRIDYSTIIPIPFRGDEGDAGSGQGVSPIPDSAEAAARPGKADGLRTWLRRKVAAAADSLSATPPLVPPV